MLFHDLKVVGLNKTINRALALIIFDELLILFVKS